MSSASLLSSGFPAETVSAIARGALEAYIVAAGLTGSCLRSSSIRRFVIWHISYREDFSLNSQIRRGPGGRRYKKFFGGRQLVCPPGLGIARTTLGQIPRECSVLVTVSF